MTQMLQSFRAARHFLFVLAFAVAFAERHPAQESSIDCCPGDSANAESLTAGPLTTAPSEPAPVPAVLLPVAYEPQLALRAGLIDHGSGTPKPLGIATYVLVSSFRI